MKRNDIMREVELSYEELKCMEVHFRQLQKEMVVHTLKQTPGQMGLLLGKITSTFSTTDQPKHAKTGF